MRKWRNAICGIGIGCIKHKKHNFRFQALAVPHRRDSRALGFPSSEQQIQVDLIDVKCDKDLNGMTVTIDFAQPFNGVIYSRGYFSESKCRWVSGDDLLALNINYLWNAFCFRYVSVGQNKDSYTFVVPYKGCGSKRSCKVCDSVDNILIIQSDEEVQSSFDLARKISCSATGVEEEKKIYFKPIIVDMLEVLTVPTKSGGVDCWMDIQRGVYPKITTIGDVIKIGEELSVLVYLRDPRSEYDLTVRNCWAYDDDDFDSKSTGRLRLSDANGCSARKKLFGAWQRTTQTGDSGATLLVHNVLRAFKFPDKSQVYLKCDIEVKNSMI